jgi:endonuclease YncB( thermonuclease family)
MTTTENINDIENKTPLTIIIYSSYTEAQKRANLKWQQNNKDKIKIYNEKNKEKIRLATIRYVEQHKERYKEKWRQYSKKAYDYNKECKRLCNISVF